MSDRSRLYYSFVVVIALVAIARAVTAFAISDVNGFPFPEVKSEQSSDLPYLRPTGTPADAVLTCGTPGTIDTSFGAGTVVTAIGGNSENASTVAIQSDGKIVAAGYSYSSSSLNTDFALVRYNTDGTLDTTFNGTGKVVTPIGSGNDAAKSVAIQSDGKIVVAGYSSNGSNFDFALARYNPNGSLDTTFNGSGKVVTPIGSGDDFSYSVAIQTDGKIVAAGYSSNGLDGDFALARYNTNGSPDTTFNGTGMVVTPISADDSAYSVAIQTDGKIVAAGSSQNLSNFDFEFSLARYNTNGSLDTTFNGTGKVVTPFSTDNDAAQSVAIQSDGRIVAAGYASNGTDSDFALARYNAIGTLDTSFNGSGKVLTPIGSSDDAARSVAIQSDGKIVAAGYSNNGANNDFALARYDTTGNLDTTYNGTGKVVTAIRSGNDLAASLAVQTDGRIVAAGYSYNGSSPYFALARYNTNGSLDTTFGRIVTPIGSSQDAALSVAIQTDGKIVAAGYSYNGANNFFALARYNTNGTLDTTFNGTGKVVTPIGGSDDSATSVAIQTDGKIVATGSSFNGFNYDFALVRYNTDGTLDTTFNGTGMVITQIGGGNDVAYSVALQTDGKIVAAGYSSNGSNNDFALARYNTNGTLDTTFNGMGKVVTPIGSFGDFAKSVAIQTDGKIVAAGYSLSSVFSSNPKFALARYNTNGTLDTTFNGGGTVITQIGGSSNDAAASVAIQSDGRIVAAGASYNGSNNDFALARYNPNGTLDTAFNGNGTVITQIGGGDDVAYSVAIQTDGKIVAAGSNYNGSEYDFALARYNPNGTLDTTFNGSGKVTTPVGGGSDSATSVAIQSDGEIVAAGSSSNGSDDDFALVRYFGADCVASTPTNTPTNTPTSTPTATATSTPGAASISGTVTYGNAAAPPKYISNVTVTGTGSPNVFTTTAAPGGTAGQYTLTGFGAGSYTVSLSKTTGQNGITSNDAARIAQHVSGAVLLTTNNQKVSAAVSNNGVISSFDAAQIATFVATGSSAGIAGQWRFFVPPGPTFPVGSSPTSRTYPSVASNLTGEDYVGLLSGEVTGNWVPSAARTAGRDGRVPTGPERGIGVQLPQLATPVGKEIVVPVSVQGVANENVISYEFDLRYDPSVIQPVGDVVDVKETASRGLSVVTNATEPGLLRVVVYGALPLDKDGVLLNLRFTAVGAPSSISPISFERIMFNEGEPRVVVTDGAVEIF